MPRATVVPALVMCVAACTTAVGETRTRLQALRGRPADDVMRELGAPATAYVMPESRHLVYVYEKERAHVGSVIGTIIGGMGSGLSGRPSTVQPRRIGCRFEVEIGQDGRVIAFSESGEGC